MVVGNIQRRVSRDQRVCVDAEGRIVLPGNILPSHHQLGENNLDRQFGRETQTGLELRKSSAGSDPDSAVRLFGETVEVAVVPRQAVARIVVAPAGTIPHVHAPLRTSPQTTRRVGFKKVHEPIGTRPLNGLVDCQSAALQMDAVDAPPETVPNPDCPVGTRTQRKHFLIAQTVVAREIFPASVRQREKSIGAAGPHAAITSLSDSPYSSGGQLRNSGKLL